MKIQAGSSTTHFELTAKNSPVTLTPGQGFQTHSLLSSSAAPKGCIASLVDWVKSLFQKIWNVLTCQFSSSKTKEASEIEDAEEEEVDPIKEKLTEWLSRYYPTIGDIWENMSFEEQQAFFWKVVDQRLPIQSKEEENLSLEWLQLTYPTYAPEEKDLIKLKQTLMQPLPSFKTLDTPDIDGLIKILIENKQTEHKEKISPQNVIEIMKENEDCSTNFFTQDFQKVNSSDSSIKFQVGPCVEVKTRFFDRFYFSESARSLCASFAFARSSIEGKLYTPYDIQQEVLKTHPTDIKDENGWIDVKTNETLLAILQTLAPINKVFQYMGSDKDAKFKSHDFNKNGQIYLVCCHTYNHIDKPIADNSNIFLPLIQVD